MSRGQVHNALSGGPLATALSRAVGDTVQDDGLERYGETLTPVLNLWREPEWAYLRQEVLASFDKAQIAVAGEASGIALVNPTGSNRLYVVEQITAWASVQVLFTVSLALEGVISATFGAVTVPSSIDTRWRDKVTGADKVTGIVYGGSDPAGVGGAVDRFTTPSGGSNYGFARLGVPMVLQPGWGVACLCGTVNTAISVGMRYRERNAFRGELD